MTQVIYESIDNLFDKYFALLVIYSQRFVHSYDLAEDIVQETFLKLWEKDPEQKYSRSYLFACIHNRSLNYIKKKKFSLIGDNFEKGLFSDDITPEEEIVEEFEKLKSLFKALDKLPPKTLEVLKKVYFEEKQYAQVAKEMGLSLNTIKAHMYHAIKLLKKILLIGWLFILDFLYSI